MSVVIETTLGDITVDLYLKQRPATCLNFLKLCKMKYYNFNLFHTIRSGFIAQTGDPTGEGSGGESIWGLLEGSSKRFFSGEKMPKIRHTDAGLLSMVCTDDLMVGSQFFFTLGPDIDSLDGVHCVIGEVTEGHEVLTKLNEVICDETHRPYQDVRITHTVVLEDPFNDPPGLKAPSRSPSPNPERLRGGRLAPDEEIDETQGKSHEEIQEMIEEKEAKARATILEIVGDLPDADIAPPENVLFVCKLNPVTTDDDLEIIFSRFGKIVSCEVIRDKKTGDSLQYAFIEFDDKKSCEEAYFKMDNVLIDDRRIHVDFSQSVSKMRWLGKGRGVQYFNEKDPKPSASNKYATKIPSNRERHDDRPQFNKDRGNQERDEKNKRHKEDAYERNSSNIRTDRKRSRSRTRRDSPNEWNSRNDRNHGSQTLSHSKEFRYDKVDKNHTDNSNRNDKNRREENNYDKNNKQTRSSPSRHGRRDRSRSLIRQKEKKEHKRNDKRERSKDRHVSRNDKSHEKDPKEETNHKVRRSDKRDLKYKKEYKRSHKRDSSVEEPNTPSPVMKKKKAKLKKNVKKKAKAQISKKKNKNRRKHSTSSSASESTDSTSSSSESSSSSDDDNRKRLSRKRKRYSSSSSSSSTSTSSSSSSSSSNSSSSISSSDSECNKKKRCKKTEHIKTREKLNIKTKGKVKKRRL